MKILCYRCLSLSPFSIHITGECNELYASLCISPENKCSSAASSRCIVLPDQAVVFSDVCFLALKKKRHSLASKQLFSSLFHFGPRYFFFSCDGFVLSSLKSENSRYMLVMDFNCRRLSSWSSAVAVIFSWIPQPSYFTESLCIRIFHVGQFWQLLVACNVF